MNRPPPITVEPSMCTRILLLLSGFVGLLAAAPRWLGAESPERPNIVFFLTDDQRNDTLGCAGHPVVRTPAIDRLARDGVLFENMFVTTSICAASRASLFTGLVERTHGYTFGTPPIPEKFVSASYPTLLRNAGYRTGFVGKFGVACEGDGPKAMFDSYTPLNRNPYFKKTDDGKRHLTDIIGDEAIEFVKAGTGDQPFCLSVSFNAVHAEDSDKWDPYPWPPSEDGLYDDITIPGPRLEETFDELPDFLQRSMNRTRWHWRWDTPEKYQRHIRAYYRMLTGLDRNIGRVVEALEKAGVADNTILIYSADNGYYMGDRGFAGKWSHFEESLRVPLIIYDPRLPEHLHGRTTSEMTLNIDIPATILQYAGLEVPEHYQGQSVLPVVAGVGATARRDDFFCEHLMDRFDIPKWEGVRDQRYVYARYFEQDPPHEFLHDLRSDPNQTKNLAEDPRYGQILSRMRRRTDELKERYEKAR